ncbi:MAG: c-type cytochrome domain-containing protein [Pirellulaceae bacterium]
MRRFSYRRRTILCIWLAAFLLGASGVNGQDAGKPIDFVHQVVPILKAHCVTCHGGREKEGDFSINTRADLLKSEMVDLEEPEESYLLHLITSDDPNAQMPPSDRARVSASEIEIVRRWIEQQIPGMKISALR